MKLLLFYVNMTKQTIFSTSLGLFLLSIIIDPYIIGFCSESDQYCVFGSLAHSIGKPMFYLFFALLVLSFIALFLRNEIFKIWFLFARIWVLLSVLLILITPEYSSGLVPIDRGRVSLALSTLFIIISLILIISKFLSLKKK